MPPIARIYKKSIITAAVLLAVLGIGGFVFRAQVREFFDFRKMAEEIFLPQEKTAEEIQEQNESDNNIDNDINNNGGNIVQDDISKENENSALTDNDTDDFKENTDGEVLGAAIKKKPLPPEINLKVPFTSQAPNAVWELPYGEACEEASALMVHYFYRKKTFTKESADKEILKIVDFQNKKYGFYKDTTAEETARFIKDLWKYKKVRVVPATVEGIKRELAAGRPVIIPAAGRMLGNPNFRRPGPLYHMLVIKGYTKDGKFITNDPGTRRGANYVYDQKVLMNAIHDWNGGDVNKGKKLMIVIDPNNP